MRHYFIDRERSADEYFTFDEQFCGVKYKFHSCNDVFSKNGIDEGTKTLVMTFLQNFGDGQGELLDIGCGYGAIGITLAKNTQYNITMADVNATALGLAKENVKENHVSIANIIQSDLYDSIDKKFDFIVTNPPIKTGKALLFNLVTISKEHMQDGAKIVLVIRKSHGQESLQKHMLQIFGNCEILKRNKGYYILCSTK